MLYSQGGPKRVVCGCKYYRTILDWHPVLTYFHRKKREREEKREGGVETDWHSVLTNFHRKKREREKNREEGGRDRDRYTDR